MRAPFVLVVLAACSSAPSVCPPSSITPETDVPTIPVGWDAYRMWDRWPYLRIGMRAYMPSTYDRNGGNEGADASHFLRLESDRAIAADVRGQGVLMFARANNAHGSPWHYRFDGQDHVLDESSLAAPIDLLANVTQGSDIRATPIGFTSSFDIGYGHTHYGTGYFIYDAFPIGAGNLSQPIASWSTPAPQDVIDLVDAAGKDIAASVPNTTALSGTITLAPSTAKTVFDAQGPSVIRSLVFTCAESDADALANVRIRMTWDGRPQPSVDAPLPLFFGTGSLFARDGRTALVHALPVNVDFVQTNLIRFAVYFPMPYFHDAHVELVADAQAPASAISWEARTTPYTDKANWAGYFHATYVDQGTPTAGVPLTLLDTTQIEGGGDFCGHFVGTSFTFSDNANLTTLEGDPIFTFDDSSTPQAHGTGTEEWGGGGDYWNGGKNTTLAFFGHPVGAPSAALAMNADDAIESAYRFLLADLMPFGKNARIRLEHGGLDASQEHYRTIAYWYGLPGACLVKTDTSSALTDFTLAIDPANFGVLLRRTLDYTVPDQMGEVWISSDGCDADAGTWYTAGSNVVVYSNPPGELDGFAPVMETTTETIRDDEFLVPRALTEGKSSIHVRIVPAAGTTWTSLGLTAYVWKLPPAP